MLITLHPSPQQHPFPQHKHSQGGLGKGDAKDDKGRLANGNTIEQEIANLLSDIADNTAASAGNGVDGSPATTGIIGMPTLA